MQAKIEKQGGAKKWRRRGEGDALIMEDMRMAVVKKTWRCMWKGSFSKKYCSMTSRQTKSSSGSVVNMFSPKQNRATLMSVSFCVRGRLSVAIYEATQRWW